MKSVKHRPDIEDQDHAEARQMLARHLRRLLNAESTVLDVGANTGQFAAEVLSSCSVRNIFCFEPVAKAFRELEVAAAKEPAIVPVRKAVSAEKGSLPFYVMKSDVGSSLLRPLAGQHSQWLTPCEEILVECIRLDDFIKSEINTSENPNISLLKCDAQGHDLAVLHSAGEYLRPSRIRSVLVEANFNSFYHEQDRYYEVFSYLESCGYRMAWLYPHRAHDEWLWWADVLFVGKEQECH